VLSREVNLLPLAALAFVLAMLPALSATLLSQQLVMRGSTQSPLVLHAVPSGAVPLKYPPGRRSSASLLACSQSSESIYPCTWTAGAQRPNATLAQDFTIDNESIEDDFFSISCSRSGAIASCTPRVSTLTVGSHDSERFYVDLTMAAAGGTGTATITASGALATLTATVTVSVNPIGVSPISDFIHDAPFTSYSQNFTVQNLGNASATINLSKICDASLSCSITSTNPVTVGATSSATATVHYTTGALETSFPVKLVAVQSGQPTWADTGVVTFDIPSPLDPIISTIPQNGYNRNTALCAAGCFDAMVGYSTPAYYSMDTPRSITVLYSSATAYPRGVVQLDVTDPSVRHADKFSLSLKRPNNSSVNFTNGSTELFFTASTVQGAVTRLAGQFDASSDTTRAYQYTATVKSYWTTGPDSGTMKQSSVPVRVLVVNEKWSAMGAGWSIAGLQHLYLSGDSVMITDGSGSAAFFTTTSCGSGCSYASPTGDFSVLTKRASVSDSVQYDRKYPDGTTASFTSDGRLKYLTDRFANTATYGYDGSGHLTSVTDPAGKSLTLAYTSGKLASITDPGGRVSTFSVNGTSGDLSSIRDPAGVYTFQGTYDSNHRLTQRTDRAGSTWLLRYDFASKLSSDSTPSVLAGGTTQRLGTRYVSTESAVLIDPSSGTGSSSSPATQRLRDSVRAVVVSTTGDTVRYAVDAFGAPTRVEQPLMKTVAVVTRDAASHTVKSVTTVRGVTVQTDSAVWSGSLLTEEIDVTSGLSATHAYDTRFQIDTLTSGSTQRVRSYVNSTGKWVDSVRTGSAGTDTVTKLTHDSRGRTTKLEDPKGDTTRYTFQTTGFQNTSSVAHGNRVTSYAYDAYGRLTTTTLPGGATLTVQYDSLNRVRRTSGPHGVSVATAYDSLYVKSITDAKGQVYQYGRNALGWVVKLTNANDSAQVDSFYYSKAGAVTKHKNRRGQNTNFTYDQQGRLTSRTLSNGQVSKFSYDTAGYFVADSNAESIDTVKTSTNGLSTSEIAIQAGTTYLDSSKVDASGLLRSAVFKQGSTTIQSISYGYDQARRLDTIKVGSSARTLLYYNADGLLVKRKLPSSDSIMVSVTHLHQPYTVKYGRSSLNSALGAQYTLDTLDRVVARFNWAGDTSSHFAYDSVGRLTDYDRYSHSDSTECVPDAFHMDGQVCTTYGTATLLTSESYAYDSVGNRTDHSAVLVGGNRLTSFNGYTLEYDADGNLEHKSKSGFDQHLYWNSINQLDSVTTNGVVVKFGYDANGRRVRKTSSTGTIRYIYSGDQVLAEVDQATGSVKRLYSYYPGVDAPHSVVEGGKTYYYLTEPGAGSVVGLIDSTGVLKNSYRYSPYGLLEDSTEAVVNPLRYTAREYDAETQLYYYRARYYDPALARFISEDPAGQSAGNNQYAYAADDPVNRRDPRGLSPWSDLSPFGDNECIPYADGSCALSGSSRGVTTLGFAWGGCIGWGCDDAATRSTNDAAIESMLRGEVVASYSGLLAVAAGAALLSGVPDAVGFAGITGNLFWGTGGEFAFGEYYDSSDGSVGFYIRGGVGFGMSGGAGVEFVGLSSNMQAFSGRSDGFCIGVWVFGYCHSSNKFGSTDTFSLGKSYLSTVVPLVPSYYFLRTWTLPIPVGHLCVTPGEC
jgi:RHS repeat-associated core domain